MSEVVLNQRYRLIEKVGEGGMAQVYRAEDLLLGRTVAVKILREQYASDEAFLKRFREEARAAAGLTHPNVVSIYDVGVDGEQNYIIMEYVSGPTLKESILNEAPFSASRAVEIALQILAAVGAAHQRGIVHRDLKPQNILITSDGQVKVADFGIARAATGAQFTETGIVLGTVHYISPEQAMGQPAVPASDLYSLGVILYEMLTGSLPFDSENALGVALKHVQEDPEPPAKVNPRVPAQLSAMVMRSLAKDPAQRFPAAEQMRLALRSYLEFGDQATSPITPVTATAARQPSQVGAQAQRRGFDWFVLIASLLTIGFILGSIPVAIRVYEAYMMPMPPSEAIASPTESTSLATEPTATPTPRRTAPAVETPVDAPQPTATEVPTPTATATPTVTPTPVVKVPALVGKTKEEAQREAEAAGVRVRVMGEEHSDRYPKDVVISQTVPEETQVERGAVIGVVLSKGPSPLKMPNVVGWRQQDARQLLEVMGLKVTTRDEADPAPVGTVIDQRPAEGESIKEKDEVTLIVSRGQPTPPPTQPPADTVQVPNVVGLPESEGQALIEQSGLSKTYVNYQRIHDVPADSRADFVRIPVGHIVSQQPLPGQYVKKGTTVYIAVRIE